MCMDGNVRLGMAGHDASLYNRVRLRPKVATDNSCMMYEYDAFETLSKTISPV